MSKKRRFRKKTLGRLQMFFEKNPYTGAKGFTLITKTFNCLIAPTEYTPRSPHYKYVTKKTVYHTNNSFC